MEQRTILLLDPEMPESEQREVEAIAHDDACLEDPWILVPTGGTSGQRRWAKHTWTTLMNSAQGYLDYFGDSAADAVCVLPLHHVGGMMPLVRAILGKGRISWGGYRSIGHGLHIPPGASVSLVPTQLQRLLSDGQAKDALKQAGRIFLGGALAGPALLETARAADLPLAPSYGMTETAAMVTALKPEQFLNGAKGSGHPLPHVSVEWGETVEFPGAPGGKVRRLGLRSSSLCAGYWPEDHERDESGIWWTSDAAIALTDGSLDILGRLDRVLISGGENVDAAGVEAVLLGLRGVVDAFVWGQPHPEWGEQVVAALEVDDSFEPSTYAAWIEAHLTPAERPKRYLPLESLPRNDLGKLDRRQLALLVDSRGLP